MRVDPKSNLAMTKPKNEQTEKEKFRKCWENFDKGGDGKIYNPRFQYGN